MCSAAPTAENVRVAMVHKSMLTRRQILKLAATGTLTGGLSALSGCRSSIVRVDQSPTTPTTQPTTKSYDLIVYGGTPSGIIASLAAAKAGANVSIIEPTNHVGGVLTSGLGVTDSLSLGRIGGLTVDFYLALGKRYGNADQPSYVFEPHVAESVFIEMLDSIKIPVYFQQNIASTDKSGTRIVSVTLDDGNILQASQWIDASYEGDLMAAAGVNFTVGRESRGKYNESLAGWGNGRILANISPYQTNGNLLPGVNPDPMEQPGDGDSKIMAYSFRSCLTTNKSNSSPFPKPAGYDAGRFEALSRFVSSRGLTRLSDMVIMLPTINQKFCLLTTCQAPNPKYPTCFNPFSTNYIGGSWNYPNAGRSERVAIWNDHYEYVAGWLYFVANDSSVPTSIRSELQRYGLPLDEFKDNNHWPWQMYVRESRRMVGQYVMAQSDVQNTVSKQDAIGLGSWYIDVHHCDQYAIAAGSSGSSAPNIALDGLVQESTNKFQIPYRSLLPKAAEVSNLAVTCCLSSSHLAFSAIRIEPTFMMIGEAAGTAAALAIKAGSDLSAVDVPTLQATLSANGGILN